MDVMTLLRWGLGVAALATLVGTAAATVVLPEQLTATLYIIVGWVLPDPAKIMKTP